MGCLAVIFWFWVASILFHCHPFLAIFVLLLVFGMFNDNQ